MNRTTEAIHLFLLLVILELIIGVFVVFGEARQLKIYHNSDAFIYQEANNFLDSTKISLGNNFIEFKPLRGNNRFGFDDPKGKKYSGAFNNSNAKVDVVRKKYSNKVEEFIIVKDSTLNNFQYIIKTNCQLERVGNYINISGIGYIDKPVAKDSFGQTVNVIMQLSGDTLTYVWSKNDSFPNIKLPIEIDPTVIIKSDTSKIRDAGVRSDLPTNNFGGDAEVFLEGSTTIIARVYRWFDVSSITSNATIDSVIDSTLYNATGAAGASNPLTMHRVTSAWTEMALTHNNQPTWDSSTVGSSKFTFLHRTNTTGGWSVLRSDSVGGADSLRNWVQQWVSGTLTNNGVLRRYANENSGTRNYVRVVMKEDATPANRPSLTIYYSILNVYAADSLRGTNDTTGFTLDSLALVALDLAQQPVGNKYAIRFVTQGAWADTGKILTLTQMKYTYAQWKAKKIYGLPKNYTDTLEVWSYATNGTDSLKVTRFARTRGAPASGGITVIDSGERAGRYNPIYKRPRRKL